MISYKLKKLGYKKQNNIYFKKINENTISRIQNNIVTIIEKGQQYSIECVFPNSENSLLKQNTEYMESLLGFSREKINNRHIIEYFNQNNVDAYQEIINLEKKNFLEISPIIGNASKVKKFISSMVSIEILKAEKIEINNGFDNYFISYKVTNLLIEYGIYEYLCRTSVDICYKKDEEIIQTYFKTEDLCDYMKKLKIGESITLEVTIPVKKDILDCAFFIYFTDREENVIFYEHKLRLISSKSVIL